MNCHWTKAIDINAYILGTVLDKSNEYDNQIIVPWNLFELSATSSLLPLSLKWVGVQVKACINVQFSILHSRNTLNF